MLDLTLNVLVLRLVALVFIVAVHGAAVAATAVELGDEGPRHDGRLTLYPFAHSSTRSVRSRARSISQAG